MDCSSLSCIYILYTKENGKEDVISMDPYYYSPYMYSYDYMLPSNPMDPPPILSNNPSTINVVLRKELTGYPNYGNPSGNADILYTDTRGVWTFDLPFSPIFLQLLDSGAQLVISAALDDHYDVPENRYSARIVVNGEVVHTGRLPLVHGRPSGQMFNNWRLLVFNVPNLRRNNRITIINTSNTGIDDWIGFDYMELRATIRA